MAKTDKSKKATSKRADPIKAAPVSTKKILEKAAALAKRESSSEDSDSDSSEEATPPVKVTSGASPIMEFFTTLQHLASKKESGLLGGFI